MSSTATFVCARLDRQTDMLANILAMAHRFDAKLDRLVESLQRYIPVFRCPHRHQPSTPQPLCIPLRDFRSRAAAGIRRPSNPPSAYPASPHCSNKGHANNCLLAQAERGLTGSFSALWTGPQSLELTSIFRARRMSFPRGQAPLLSMDIPPFNMIFSSDCYQFSP